MYGAPWCPDCERSKKFLDEQRVDYRWIDVDLEPSSLEYIQSLQRGGRTIPTIVFDDGTHLLEPSNEELSRKLGLTLETKQ